MQNQIEQNIKKNGIIYTPELLAQYIANGILELLPVQHGETLKILDPSVGDGELLKSIYTLSQKMKIKTELWGVDTDQHALECARKKLENVGATAHLISEDFLNFNSKAKFHNFFDIVISNPPYVSTQTMGGKDTSKLSQRFGLRGKIDLYQAFYVSLSNILKPKGYIGVITSNKFMFNKTGSVLRQHLLNEYNITKIVDLGDTKLFSAAVLPAIVFGTKKPFTFDIAEKNKTNFIKIYSKPASSIKKINKLENVYDLLKENKSGCYETDHGIFEITKGVVQFSGKSGDVWNFSTDEEYDWVKKIDEVFPKKISDIGKIHVGIKTTADNVFIDGLERLDTSDFPESELIFDLITASSIEKWRVVNSHKRILYTHIPGKKKKSEVINLELFPKAKKYLYDHYEQLNSRSYIKKSGREWFEIWVPQDPEKLLKPKIVFPDISERPRFAYDEKGMLVAGNAYWFSLNEGLTNDWNFLVLGMANSKLLEKYHDIKFQNKLYSSKRRYISQYVEQYPIPDFDSPISRRIIDLVKKVIAGEANMSKIDHILDEYVLRHN